MLTSILVAVLAFKAVVTLELKRRDNDQKIIALQVKMQDMMSILVQFVVFFLLNPHSQLSPPGYVVSSQTKQTRTAKVSKVD
jgi:hypothetical protein